jgi:chemotaxis protein histidine kinase CheA
MTRRCKEAKRVYDKAYYQANKENIDARNKAYREANKEKFAVRAKAWREANKEKIKAYNKAYKEANKEKIAVKKKAYYQTNKERLLAKYKAYSKAYRKDNREKLAALKAKHRAAKRKRIPIKVRDCPIEKYRVNQIYKLSHMFTKATGVQHHVDHMWPLSKKGPHWSGNLQIITATENLTKNAKLNKDIKATVREMLKDIKDAY